MTAKKTRSNRSRGRPSRAQASARALENVDLEKVDPRLVLLQIAADRSSPATARVAACRVLLAAGGDEKKRTDGSTDPVTELALKLLRGKNR